MSGIFNSLFSRVTRRDPDLSISVSLTERDEREPPSSYRDLRINLTHSLSDMGDNDYQHDFTPMQSSTNIVSVLNTPRRVYYP